MEQADGIRIIYDGDCPFCRAYVGLQRVRANVGEVALIDARSVADLVQEMGEKGYDLNAGMVVQYDGRDYFGADAVHVLAVLSARPGVLSRLMRRRGFARLIYPVLRLGRNGILRLMNRDKI